MVKRLLVWLATLLLVILTVSGCVWYGGHAYDGPHRGHGYYGYGQDYPNRHYRNHGDRDDYRRWR